MNHPEFELADKGGHHIVIIFEDFVIKTPRRAGNEDGLKDTIKIQNELAECVDGVLPCKYHNGCLVMPKAPGIRVDLLEGERRGRAEKLMEEMKKKFTKHGYRPGNMTPQNVFYDEIEDKIYFIDLHLVERRKR